MSRDGRWTRLAVAAVAALLWVVTQAAVSASAAPGDGLERDDSSVSTSSSARGGGSASHPGKGPLPGSVRWR